ncbi:autotransporter domain-containing protein [Chitinolyticbacter meiyuanensis]|uniref:autotransporter domain-containing protein n=1 Tax=Chitinolyticbacter meiyuanensis TaxID=682798 RepID=UPI0011E5CA10|nr:autotransporter domain-containing protein [Chitinolyticbacter meiyuanensis]
MLRYLIALPLVLSATVTHAGPFQVVKGNLTERANSMLALMTYSTTPDLTSSSLSISDTETGNPDITMSQLGGGFTISKETPLYLEGAIAYSRYDPQFVVSNGTETRDIRTKWTSISGTGGIGWDFPIADEWVIRPIFNFALGYMSSDLNTAHWYLEHETGRDIRFLDGGDMSAGGVGGSLMLDWEHYRPDYEIDLELRYSYIYLENLGHDKVINGHAEGQTANLWARWRAPTGLTVMQRPLRYVLEVSHSEYLGDQAGVLGFERLSTLGAGIEFDSSAYDIIITRTRLVLRHVMGDNVSGFSLGFAVSF